MPPHTEVEDQVKNLFSVDLDNLTSVIRYILGQLKDHENTIAKQQTQIEGLTERVTVGEKERAGLKQEIKTERDVNNDQNKRLDAMRDELDKLKGLGDLPDKLSELAKRVDALDGVEAAEKLEKRVKDLEDKQDKLDKDVQAHSNAIAEASKAREHLDRTKMDKSALDGLAKKGQGTGGIQLTPEQRRAIDELVPDHEEQLNKMSKKLKELEALKGLEKRVVKLEDLGERVTKLEDVTDRQDRQIEATQDKVQALSDLLGTKADKGDAAEVNENYATVAYVDKNFHELFDKDNVKGQQIHELYNKDNSLEAMDASLTSKDREQQGLIDELRDMFDANMGDKGLTEDELASLASRDYVDKQYADLMKKLRKLEKAGNKSLRVEMKRFERDVMVYLDDTKQDWTEAGIGRVHFRCLSCDQVTNSQHNPKSELLSKSLGAALQPRANHSMERPANMMVERGDEVTLYGRDGQVYKGRNESVVNFAPSDKRAGNAKFTVNYRDRHPFNRPPRDGDGAPPRPRSAHPAQRAQQPVANQNHNHNHNPYNGAGMQGGEVYGDYAPPMDNRVNRARPKTASDEHF